MVTGVQTTFPNLPPGTRAVALPDNSYNRSTPFLNVFGRPEGASVCECERVQSSSLAQSLFLINDSSLKSKLANSNGWAKRLVDQKSTPDAKVRELYLVAFSREPREAELKTALTYLAEPRTDSAGNPLAPEKAAFENMQDLIWALLNTKEFLFNH